MGGRNDHCNLSTHYIFNQNRIDCPHTHNVCPLLVHLFMETFGDLSEFKTEEAYNLWNM